MDTSAWEQPPGHGDPDEGDGAPTADYGMWPAGGPPSYGDDYGASGGFSGAPGADYEATSRNSVAYDPSPYADPAAYQQPYPTRGPRDEPGPAEPLDGYPPRSPYPAAGPDDDTGASRRIADVIDGRDMGDAPRGGDQFRPPEGGRKPGRAGRNLPAAIGVGVGLGAVILASLLVQKVAFVVVVVLAVGLGLRELAGALRGKGTRVALIPLLAGAVGMIVAAYTGGPQALCAALALTVLVVVVWRMVEGPENFLRDATASVFTALYAPFLASFAVLMAAPHDGAKRVIVFIVLTVCSDTGGYAAGVISGGKHPMAPRISPKKSWEGLVGSVLVAAVGGAVATNLLLHGQYWQGVVLGLAAVATATFGDLAESMIKRDLGIKDMGTLLPGHGGIMDRLDSLLATAPVVWLLLSIFVPVH